jgi:hypothetical protein
MCFMATASGHFIGAFIGRGRFFMHRVELLNWHCAEFSIYHGTFPVVSFSEQQRYHSFF